MYWQRLVAQEKPTKLQRHSQKERQQSITNCGCCILYNPRAVLRLLPILEVLTSCVVTMVNVDVATPQNELQQSVNTAPTERQQFINRASTERQLSIN
jgi:hypothetical protein